MPGSAPIQPPALPVAVTTAQRAAPEIDLEARTLARDFGLPFVERGDRSLPKVFASGFGAVLVVGRQGVDLVSPDGSFTFAARMAELRIKRLRKGDPDPLAQLTGAGPGVRILDATAGLCADALTLASTGAAVTAVESSPVLAAFASCGLKRLPGQAGSVADRIRLLRGDHRQLLADAEPGEWDAICFDPMFRVQPEMEAAFDVFRILANSAPLDAATLHRARRVATQAVIVKDGPDLKGIKGLGVTPDHVTTGSRVRFAVYRPFPPAAPASGPG